MATAFETRSDPRHYLFPDAICARLCPWHHTGTASCPKDRGTERDTSGGAAHVDRGIFHVPLDNWTLASAARTFSPRGDGVVVSCSAGTVRDTGRGRPVRADAGRNMVRAGHPSRVARPNRAKHRRIDAAVRRPERASMMRLSRRQWLLGISAGALIGGGYVWSQFRQAVDAADRRVAGRSSIVSTQFGKLEYAIAGSGSPLLMVHGTGGGFDQGLRFAAALQRLGHRIIAPSRFGYLRSDFPVDPSLANQADAFAALLDHLAIDRLAVTGGSAGALSATAFALRHPDRCSALVLLVPAANVDGSDPVKMSALQERIVRTLLNSDFAYWSALNTAPETLIGTLLATDPALMSRVNQTERARAFAILSEIMPIGARAKGMLNDAKQAGHPAAMDFAKLRMPVLLISAEDDRFGTAATARKIAKALPTAQVTILPDGGHIWLGHDNEVAERMHRFLAISV